MAIDCSGLVITMWLRKEVGLMVVEVLDRVREDPDKCGFALANGEMPHAIQVGGGIVFCVPEQFANVSAFRGRQR